MEDWKTLHNFPGYEGSTEGRIKNIRTQQIVNPSADKNGRERVYLQRDRKKHAVHVSKAIADTFLGEQTGLDIWHKDHNKGNHRPDNLEWRTRSETTREGLLKRRRQSNIFNAIRVVETGNVYQTVAEAARAIGCDKSQIYKCLSGKIARVKGYSLERV